MSVVFDAANGGSVEKFDRCRNNMGCDDSGNRLRSVVPALEKGEHRLACLRLGDKLQKDLRKDTERTFGSDKKILEVIAGYILDGLASLKNDLAIRKNGFKAKDVVLRDTVLQPP